ncbi:MAG: helix-turn-helix domain-containing protein [Bacteroidales bacterium]
MTRIETEKQYETAMKRIEELMPLITENLPVDDDNYIEYDLWCGLVSDYEDVHYPISTPTLGAIIKLRMYELNLTQKKVADMLGVSPSRVSEFINEKSEPSLRTAKMICQKLNIDAAIALGL